MFGDRRVPLYFWARVQPEPNSGCWLWTAAVDRYGYGRIAKRQHGHNLAHRFFFANLVGPLVEGLVIDHRCRTRSCCNPWHLEQVNPRENTRRGTSFSVRNAAKENCPRGHALSGSNLYRDSSGKRHCRACWVVHKRAHLARKAAA
jgi:hypothetical protein